MQVAPFSGEGAIMFVIPVPLKRNTPFRRSWWTHSHEIKKMRYAGGHDAGLGADVIRTDIETKTNSILVQCKTSLNVVLRPESSQWFYASCVALVGFSTIGGKHGSTSTSHIKHQQNGGEITCCRSIRYQGGNSTGNDIQAVRRLKIR